MTQLSVRANELHEQAVADFKVSERFAYSFIMKVKQIRDERLYKELGFTSFDEYCNQAWNIKRDFMDQRIQIAESFGEENFADTYRQLGHSKSLLLARMEPEVRKQVESSIDLSAATVRQLKELEKEKHDAERRAQDAEQAKRHFEQLWNQAKNQPPKVIKETVTVNVTPPDYEELKRQAVAAQELNKTNVALNRKIQEMNKEFQEKVERREEVSHAIRKLRESFKNILSVVNQEHYNARFLYDQVQGYHQVDDTVRTFLTEFGHMVDEMFREWKELTNPKAS